MGIDVFVVSRILVIKYNFTWSKRIEFDVHKLHLLLLDTHWFFDDSSGWHTSKLSLVLNWTELNRNEVTGISDITCKWNRWVTKHCPIVTVNFGRESNETNYLLWCVVYILHENFFAKWNEAHVFVAQTPSIYIYMCTAKRRGDERRTNANKSNWLLVADMRSEKYCTRNEL